MTATTIPHIRLHYGSTTLDAGSGGTFEHRNPYSGELQAVVPLAGATEINAAVDAAAAQADSWRRWSPEARRDVLNRFADLLIEHRQEFADLQALDGGTPLQMGLRMVDNSIGWTRYYAGWCDKLTGDLISTLDTRGYFSYSVPEPIGVVGIITTWNGPIISLGMKVMPALAAGNCVVVKPSEFTPFGPDRYRQLLKQAGVPDGVCSILGGAREAGEALIRHPKIEKVSFTGGLVAARSILHLCAEQFKPAVVELGGKTASIVFPDAGDLDGVAARAVRDSIGIMAGQGCALPTRLIVHEDIYDAVVEKACAVAATYKMGDPFDPSVMVGPLINAAAVERVGEMLARVRRDNPGSIVIGGHRADGDLADKNFIEPTIIVDVDPDHEIAQTEVFGPVLAIFKFSTEDEAVALANSTPYGLAANIQSTNLTRVHRVAERLKAGGVYVNGARQNLPHTPFGGVGISGYGKEGGRAGIDEFVRYKTVSIIDPE